MMKRIWAMRKDSEAVSPVIATILMVAITVVLAAVLYVMVLGFTPTTSSNIVISFSQGSSATNYTLTVSAIQGGTLQLTDCRALFQKADATQAYSGLVSTLNNTWNSNIKYNDANSDGKLNAPDYIQMKKGTGFFDVGSKMILSNIAGTNTYTTVTIA